MSARAFPITLCPSSVRLSVCPSVCPSVRLFFKTYLLLQFWSDSFQILYRYQVWYHSPGLCFFWRSDHFWIFGGFLKFWNNGMIYSNFKMHLLLQFWSDSFEISCRHQVWYHSPGLCFFWASNYFWIFGDFLKFCNNVIIYSNCKMHLLLQFWSDSFEISYRHQVWYHSPTLCFFLSIKLFLNFWRFFEILK